MEVDLLDRVNQLQVTLDKMESTLEAIADAVVWVDASQSVEWCNAAFDRLIGQPRTAILGAPLTELLVLHQNDQPLPAAQYPDSRIRQDSQTAAGAATEYEWWYAHDSGTSPIHRILSISGQLAAAGVVVLVFRDITQAKAEMRDRQQVQDRTAQLMAQIQNQSQRLENIVSSVPGVVWEAWGQPDDALQRIDFVSEHVETMLGYSVREWLATPNFWLKIVHPDDRERAAREAAAIFHSGREGTSQFRWIAKDGYVVWVLAQSVVICDESGQPVGMRGVTTNISDRKRVEEALRYSETKFRRLFENSQVGIFRTRVEDGLILDANQRFIELSGYPSTEEVIGKKYSSDFLVNPDDRPWLLSELRQHGELHNFEMEYRQRDGSRRWGLYSVRLNTEENCLEGVVTDITDRKRLEEELRQREKQLRALLDAIPDRMFRQRLDGTYLDCQGKFDGSDDTPETLIGQNMLDLPIPETLKYDLLQQFQRAVETGELQTYEHEMPHRDGIHNYEARIVKSGVDEVVCIVRDVTDRKRAEEALKASEAQYRDLIQTANCIILRWDMDGTVRFLNDYGQALLGFSQEEIAGRNVVGTIVPETETSGRDLQALMADICTHPERYISNENENICKNGDRVWVVWANKPIFDDHGNLIEILSIGTDATERKRTQAALEQSLSLLRATFESIADGILAISRSSEIVGYNQRFLEMWSVPPGLLQEPDWDTRIAYLAQQLKDPDSFVQRVRSLYATPEAESYDLLELKDGRVFERYSRPQRAGDEIIGRVWSFRDITDRRRAENAVRRSELKYRNLFENSQVGIFRCRPGDGLILEANQRFIELTGYQSPDDVIGKVYTSEFYVNLDDRYWVLEQVLTQGECNDYEIFCRKRDGTLSWCLFSIRFNSIDRCIEGVITDITDRKLAEEALRLSEAKFRALYESIGIAIILGDETTIFDCNRAAEELFGYSRQELANMPPTLLFPPHQPDDQDSSSLSQYYTACAFEQGSHRFEWVYRRADGTNFPTEVWLTAVEVGDRKLVQAIIQDMTERKQVEAELAERATLAAFRADVGSALARNDNLPAMLDRCARAAAKHLNVALARIWTANLREDVFELQASAGLYTRLDGTYRRIPIHQFLPTGSRQPYLTNHVMQGSHFLDREWAEQEGLVAFASYPLQLEDEIVGMMVMFFQQEMPESTVQALEFAAREIALGIKRNQAEEALRLSELKYRNIFENSQVGIGRTRLQDGLFLDANQRCADIMGYSSAADLIGQRFATELYANPDERQRMIAELQQRGEVHDFEVLMRLQDGSPKWGLLALRLNVEQNCIDFVITDISDRKRLEEELRQSQQFLHSIIDNIPLAIFVKDINNDFRYVLINKSSEKILGFPRGGAIGRSDQELIPYEQYRFHHQEDLNAIAQGNLLEIPDHWIGKPNEKILVRGWKLPLFDPDGNPTHLLAISEDVTERRHREQALRLIVEGTAAKTGDEFFRAFVSSLAEVLRVRFVLVSEFVNEAKTQVRTLAVWWNGAIVENFEFSLQGTPCETVLLNQTCYHPQNVQSLFPDDQDLAAIGAESYLGVPLTNSEGEVLGHLAAIDVKPMENDPGRELVLRIFAARAGAELERKQAEEALQRRAEVDSLLSSLSRQFIDQDADTAIEFALQAIAGFVHAERSCIFEYFDDQRHFTLVREWRAATLEPLAAEARGTSIDVFPWFNQRLLSGETVQVSSMADLPDEAFVERQLFEQESIQSFVAVPVILMGEVVGFLGVDVVHYSKIWSQDEINLLTLVGELLAIGRARYKAEEALRDAKNAAEAANRAKSTFLANMSHELRTPLNAILGFAQLMERDEALTARQRESLAIINRSGEHLLDLINDVLEMSKIEAGRIVLNPEPFDLLQLLHTLQDIFQLRADAKQLSLQFEIDPNLPQFIETDEGKLRQVLINLLGNAVKFTEQGGVTMRVRLADTAETTAETTAENTEEESAEPAVYILSFEVEDTGRGIAPEEMEHLFQPFVQTTSGTQTREGTGLGLTISRQFVRLMGGDIEFSSTLGHGSRFYFHIQAALATPPEAIAQSLTQGRVVGIAAGQPHYRILVVDDRPENRHLIRQLLKTVGFEVQTADNGQEAIAQWQQWQPHLIWMDMRMPVLDGYEATRRIRAAEQHPASPQASHAEHSGRPVTGPITKIIALTASAFEEQRAVILAAGCDDLVRKPFREQVIFDKMTEHLGVQFVYDQYDQPNDARKDAVDTNRDPRVQPASASVAALQPASLHSLSPEWVAALHQAALTVDGDQILQLIAQLSPAQADLAEGLADLVRRFCFDEIFELTLKATREHS